MGKIEKSIIKFQNKPKDLTWKELIKILAHYSFFEITKKGKASGSRAKFVNENNDIINLYKPYPGNIVKQYVIKQVIEKLKLWKII